MGKTFAPISSILYVILSMIEQEYITTNNLKKRSDIHYSRKLWHMMGVTTLFLIFIFTEGAFSKKFFLFIFLLFVPLDFLRQSRPSLNDFLIHLFKPIMREYELNKLAGTTYLLTGVNLIVWLFPFHSVALTLLFLAYADPIASFFGIKYGKDKIFGHKSIQGFVAAFVVCLLLCSIYLSYQGLLTDHLFIICLIGGLIGALSELVPIGKVDDNFSLPLISATGLTLLFYFFGLFSNGGH